METDLQTVFCTQLALFEHAADASDIAKLIEDGTLHEHAIAQRLQRDRFVLLRKR